MKTIFLLSKTKNIDKKIFLEKSSTIKGGVEDIFYNPAELLKKCGLGDVLDEEPFKYIRTAGGVWEFYILRFTDIGRRKYKQLIKRVDDETIVGCSRRQVGNSYDDWKRNYFPDGTENIEDRAWCKKAESFAKKLASRNCPIRQKGTSAFMEKRRAAANAFLSYLYKGTIAKSFLKELQEKNLQEKLIYLIKKYPKNDLFLVVGLMTSLYGGKNILHVHTKLARIVAKNLKMKQGDLPQEICKILNSQPRYEFKPPYKDIYYKKDVNRDLVLINFRLPTWLKLMEDTLEAIK